MVLGLPRQRAGRESWVSVCGFKGSGFRVEGSEVEPGQQGRTCTKAASTLQAEALNPKP